MNILPYIFEVDSEIPSLFMISSEVTIFSPLQRHSSRTPKTKTCKVPQNKPSCPWIFLFFFFLQRVYYQTKVIFQRALPFPGAFKISKSMVCVCQIFRRSMFFLRIMLYKWILLHPVEFSIKMVQIRSITHPCCQNRETYLCTCV